MSYGEVISAVWCCAEHSWFLFSILEKVLNKS